MRSSTLRVVGIAFLSALGWTAPTALAGDPPSRKGLPQSPPRSKEFQARVDQAVARGTAWLRKRQGPDGRFLAKWGDGETALAVLALQAGGAPQDDPQVRSGLDRLRLTYPTGRAFTRPNSTYGVALTLLALEAYYNSGGRASLPIPPGDQVWIASLTDYLVRSQTGSGGFGYGADEVSPEARLAIQRPGWWDNSNSQFAVLGLGAARLLGQDIPTEVWKTSLRHWVKRQQVWGPTVPSFEPSGKEGTLYATGKAQTRGWSYSMTNYDATGSMTAGGVSSVALCRDALRRELESDPQLEQESSASLRDGIAWLGHFFSVEGNPSPRSPPSEGPPPNPGRDPPPPWPGGKKPPRKQPGDPAPEEPVAVSPPVLDPDWHMYYLYGLERAGVLAGTAWVGTHDWYLEGAEYLLRVQHEDGSWEQPAQGDGEGPDMEPQVDTCFAVLFLKRATARIHTPTLARNGTTTLPASTGLRPSLGPELDDAGFQDLFEAVFRRFLEGTPERRETLARDFVEMGIRSIPLLIQRLGAEEEMTRRAAADGLRLTTSETPAFDPSAAVEIRQKAIQDWTNWWEKKQGSLVADAAVGRFRRR